MTPGQRDQYEDQQRLEREARDDALCTCQGGYHQPEGVRLRANDCPVHGEEDDGPCDGDIHCCCCGPGDACCDCGEIMPPDYPDGHEVDGEDDEEIIYDRDGPR